MSRKKKVKSKGTKHDSNKAGMALIPPQAMFEMAKAFSFGAAKYGKWNYMQGINTTDLVSAGIRHAYKYLRGCTKDSQSGAHHLGHALASFAMAVEMDVNKPEFDDRYYKDVEDVELP